MTAGLYVVGFLTLVAAGVVFGWLENPLWRALAVLVGTWLGLSVMARKARRPAVSAPPAAPVLPLADRGPDRAMGTTPDPSTIVNGDPAGQGEGLPQRTCEVCDTIDLTDTTARLVDRVNSGRMRYLRGDVPLEDMYDLALSDMKYTIVSYLECLECGRTRFWGLAFEAPPSTVWSIPTSPIGGPGSQSLPVRCGSASTPNRATRSHEASHTARRQPRMFGTLAGSWAGGRHRPDCVLPDQPQTRRPVQ